MQQQQQQTPSRAQLRRRNTSRRQLTPGALTTAASVVFVLALVSITFVADWLRVPEIELLSSAALISPNGDQDHDFTTISYALSEEANITVQVISPGGGVVRTLLLDQPQSAGQHAVTWDGLNEIGERVQDGQYNLELSAMGTVRASTQTLSMVVDTQAPELQLVNVPNGLRVRENALTIEGFTDPGATVLVTGSPQPVVVDQQGNFSFLFRLNEGENTLEIRTADNAGNSASLRRTVSLVTAPPEMTIASPTDDTWLNQNITTVSGHVSSDVTLTINDQPVGVAEDGSFFHQLTLTEGDNVIHAAATDDVGNVSLSEILIHVKTTPPIVTLNISEGETFNSQVLQVAGTTEAGTFLRANGQVVPVGQAGSFQFTLQLAEGANSISIEVRDQAGNVTNITRQVNYQISTPPSGLEQLTRNLSVLPSFAVPVLSLAGLIFAFLLFRQRGVSLSLSVDKQTFTPGLPGEGKVMLIWLDMNRSSRVTLEVLDANGHPLATILRDRRRQARQHTFSWDGYDDYGRAVPPGEYTIQAEAGVNPVKVTSAFPVKIGEDILVHRRDLPQTVHIAGEQQAASPSAQPTAQAPPSSVARRPRRSRTVRRR